MTTAVEARPAAADAPAAAGEPRPVRLALLVDDALAQPAWVTELLAALVADGSAELVGTGVLAPAAATSAPGAAAERAYLRLDARRYGRPNDPQRPAALGALAAPVPRVEVPAAADAGGRLTLDDAAAAGLRALGADVVWHLGARPLAEPVPDVAAWGVWAVDPAGGAHGARAMLEGAPATATALRQLADARGPGGVLGRARSSTQRISVTVNHAEHLRHVADLVGGAVRRAGRVGPPAPEPDARAGAAARPLGAVDAVRLGARAAGRLVRARAEEARTALQWTLAYHLADAPPPGAAADAGVPETDPRRFTELLPPADRYWADPFPAEHEGRTYLFYEEHLAGVRDAHLCVAEFDPARGGLCDARVVLRQPYHLSFPSVFRWQGAWYMTPETMTERAVQLYRAERFPDGWAYVGDLVAGRNFVDPVIACLDGAWWMWVGVMPDGAAEATALHLYHAPTPLGPWAPHALNPVLVDVRGGRPAGRVFARDGAYYRPVQDGAPHYGHAMAVHRVDRLTPTSFQETPVARVEPTWRPGLVGTHTLNAAGRLTVLDVLRRVPRSRPVPAHDDVTTVA